MPRAAALDYATTTWPDDPTPEEVASLAAYIAARLPQPDSTDEPAVHALLTTAHHLLRSDELTVTVAQQARECIDRLRHLTYATDTGRTFSDLAPAGWRLLRTARAAASGGCRLGAGNPCDGVGRVRVFVHDAFITQRPPGCPRHAAEEAVRWDHGRSVEVVLVGPEDACVATRARIGNRLSPTPKWVPLDTA